MSNVLEGKIGYALDNFQEAVPIFLLLTCVAPSVAYQRDLVELT